MNSRNYSSCKAISTAAYTENLVRLFWNIQSRIQSRCNWGICNQFSTLIVKGLILQSFACHLQNKWLINLAKYFVNSENKLRIKQTSTPCGPKVVITIGMYSSNCSAILFTAVRSMFLGIEILKYLPMTFNSFRLGEMKCNTFLHSSPASNIFVAVWISVGSYQTVTEKGNY